MTWQNAAFIVVGTGLLVFVEWIRSRYEKWRSNKYQ